MRIGISSSIPCSGSNVNAGCTTFVQWKRASMPANITDNTHRPARNLLTGRSPADRVPLSRDRAIGRGDQGAAPQRRCSPGSHPRQLQTGLRSPVARLFAGDVASASDGDEIRRPAAFVAAALTGRSGALSCDGLQTRTAASVRSVRHETSRARRLAWSGPRRSVRSRKSAFPGPTELAL